MVNEKPTLRATKAPEGSVIVGGIWLKNFQLGQRGQHALKTHALENHIHLFFAVAHVAIDHHAIAPDVVAHFHGRAEAYFHLRHSRCCAGGWGGRKARAFPTLVFVAPTAALARKSVDSRALEECRGNVIDEARSLAGIVGSKGAAPFGAHQVKLGFWRASGPRKTGGVPRPFLPGHPASGCAAAGPHPAR